MEDLIQDLDQDRVVIIDQDQEVIVQDIEMADIGVNFVQLIVNFLSIQYY